MSSAVTEDIKLTKLRYYLCVQQMFYKYLKHDSVYNQIF